MTDCTGGQTRRLQDTIRGQTRQQTTTLQHNYRDQTRHQTDKLTSQIDTIRGQMTDCTEGQTRRLQDTIRGQTRQQTTTLQDTYRYQTRHQTDKLTSQIDTIRGQVTDCTEGQTRRLQDTIRGQTRQQTTTLQDTYRDQTRQQVDTLTSQIDKGHLQAEEKAQERQKELQKELEELPARIAETREKEDSKYLEDVKQQLSAKYTRQYSIMRFIPSMVDEQRTTDDTFVAPELKLFSIDEEPRNLSCDEIFSLKIRNDNNKRIIVVGSPGCGKSTLIHNRIAYDWGRGVKHQQIKLLFVIDMYKVEPRSDVFEIIKDQLLRGVQRKRLEKLMEDNAQSTAFLLDGFDEVSPKWEGKGKGKSLSAVLDGTWLSGSHVIVTSRPEKLHDFNKRYQGYPQVDLLGFSDAAILDFIQKQVGKSNASANNLERAISSLSPSLSWLSKNPLTLSMLCILWKDGDQLPKGVTSLYSNIVDFMMARSYSDTDSAEAIPNVQRVLQGVGKFALQDLCGQKVMAKEVPAEYLQVSQRIGICTTHKKRERFRQRKFLTFPLHRSFQGFCAAKYLADIANTNQDQFLSSITPVVDNKNILQFCCGLSLTAASTILQHIVSTTAVNVERGDTCIFGVGPRVANPWKLPLLLLFEAESQMSEDSAKTSQQLHAILNPLVESIRMNHGNWPADNEMCHLLQYFISKKDDTSWLSQVKFAVIVFCTKIDIGPSLAREQTELVGSLSKLGILKLSSSIPQSQVSCTHILRNLRLAKYVENDSDIQQCQRTEVIFSGFNVFELDFIMFLSNQIVAFSMKLDTVTLVEETESKSHVTINSLDELIVCDSKCKGQSLGTVLSRMLLGAQTSIRLSLIWRSDSPLLKPITGNQGKPKTQNASSTGRVRQSSSMHWSESTCLSGGRIRQQSSQPWCAPGRVQSANQNKQLREAHRQSLTFDCFSSNPLQKSILTSILLSGCALNLQALTNMVKSQRDLSEITLQSVLLSGKVTEKYINENVKKCMLKNVKFFDNFANFLQQFLEVTDYHMSDIDVQDEMVEGIVSFKSLQNVTISQCTLGSNVNVLFRGPTPKLQHLDLADNSIGSDGASALAQSFQHTPALQHLNLLGNSIGSDGASALAQSIQHLPELKSLSLLGNTYIGHQGVKILTNLFSGCFLNIQALTNMVKSQQDLSEITLQSVYLYGNVTEKCINKNVKKCILKNVKFFDNFANFIQQFPEVTDYHMSDIDVEDEIVEGIVPLTSLQNVTISKCKLGSNVNVLLRGPTPKLQLLDLASNSTGSDGASALAQSFQHTPALQHLNLAWNRIGTDGASALSQSFQHTPALQHLNLAWNRIGTDGASALSQSFQHTPALQHLDLPSNSIGSDGASALAQSFQHTPALQHLNLYDNSIGSDGASALAQSFQHTPALQHLNLDGNSIGSDGASALAQSFQHTPALQHLNLDSNIIDSDGASALAQSFTHLSELKSLDLSYNNSIGPEGVEYLFRNLIYLPKLEKLDLDVITLYEKECSPLLMDCCRKIGWRFGKYGGAYLSSDQIQLVCDIVRS
ncbi:uncharacterized protein [Amphiura filiformis]|uniref:uncharacterized protein n=1 Tax=Amphiura filiformis TaxID=82378 RepID=UPI003B223326